MASGDTINVIRKIEVVEGHGHHGGAWKVAYADFMTAMMAFFLLMWILSSSDEQKLRGIAEYFTNATLPGGSGVLDGATLGPPGTLTASNGSTVARGAELGEVDDPSPAKWEVMDTTPTANPEEKVRGSKMGKHENPASGAASEVFQTEIRDNAVTDLTSAGSAETPSDSLDPNNASGQAATTVTDPTDGLESAAVTASAKPSEPDHTADEERFEAMKNEILQAMQETPDLAPLQKNIIFEKTNEGMLVQIIDQHGKPMFNSGNARMNPATEKLMTLLGQSLTKLPNDMVITGHTDAVPFAKNATYDNWDLSSDRANAMRRVLLKSGVEQERITRVSGKAATQLLKPEAPKDPANRRIEVLLSYTKPETAPAPESTDAPMANKVAQTTAPTSEPMAPKSVAEEIKAEEGVSLLDEQVFQNLRSALR